MKQLDGGVIEWTLPDGTVLVDEPPAVLPEPPDPSEPPEQAIQPQNQALLPRFEKSIATVSRLTGEPHRLRP